MSRKIKRTPLERLEYGIILSTLIFLVIITIQPLLNLFAISVSDPSQITSMSGLTVIPEGLSFEVWKLLLTHPSVHKGVFNSLLITLVGTFINIILTALMAWALAQKQLPGRRVLFLLLLLTIVFEPGIIPDYFIMKKIGLLNSYWSVILFKAVNAWYLIILIRFFEEIPHELLQAAELDGANVFQTFYYVVLPLAKPALATITLFYLVFHWNEFFRAMIYLTDQDKWPLQVILRQFVVEGDKLAMVGVQNMNEYQGASQIDIRSLKAGMIILTILPILLIYPVILKYFTKGTMAGAVKG